MKSGGGSGHHAKGTHKGRKYGRWARKPSNARYSRARNKERRILALMIRFPGYTAQGWEHLAKTVEVKA